MDFFSSGPGQVTVFQEKSLPFRMRPVGWPGAVVMNAAMVQMGFNESGSYQFTRTFRRSIYFYTFGENEGDLSIGGVFFSSNCVAGSRSGFDMLRNYYKAFRANSIGLPVDILLGTAETVRGFLLGMQTGQSDMLSGLGSFTLVFKTIPEDNGAYLTIDQANAQMQNYIQNSGNLNNPVTPGSASGFEGASGPVGLPGSGGSLDLSPPPIAGSGSSSSSGNLDLSLLPTASNNGLNLALTPIQVQ